jgi:WD40 repeat protein
MMVVIGLLLFGSMPPKTANAQSEINDTQTALVSEQMDNGWVAVVSYESVVDDKLGALEYDELYFINNRTQTKIGPFLRDELSGTDKNGNPDGGDVFDIAITPDNKTALITSFGKSLLHFVDISNPYKPVYLGVLKMARFTEDIAITADGRYALISDGGYSPNLYSVDIAKRKLAYELIMPAYAHTEKGDPIYGYTNGVDVSKNGDVVAADYIGGAVHYMTIEPDGSLIYKSSIRYFHNFAGDISYEPKKDYWPIRPVNVTFSPDGKTVLVADVSDYYDNKLEKYTKAYGMGVLRLTQPGQIELTEVITGLPHSMQSFAFSENGDKVVCLGNNAGAYDASLKPSDSSALDAVYVMNVLGPGDISFDPAKFVTLERYTSSQLFGVDGLAVVKDNVYISYPTYSMDKFLYPDRYISIVNLNTLELKPIFWVKTAVGRPGGVASFYKSLTFIPMVSSEAGVH